MVHNITAISPACPTTGARRSWKESHTCNSARQLGIAVIAEKPAAIEMHLTKEPTFEMANLMKLKERFGPNLTILPPQGLLRFRLMPSYRKNLTNFLTRVLMALAGDEAALAPKEKISKGA